MSSSSSETLVAEPLSGGGEFKAQPAPTPAALLAPTTTTTTDDGIGSSPLQQQELKATHALFTMLDYTLTPVALAVLISLVLVALACLVLLALVVKRTLYDKPKRNANADRTMYDSKQQQIQRHRQAEGGNNAIIYDISDGSRTSRSISEGGVSTCRAKTSSRSASSGSISCLVGLLVAASFIGIAVGMAFVIDRTVVALC